MFQEYQSSNYYLALISDNIVDILSMKLVYDKIRIQLWMVEKIYEITDWKHHYMYHRASMDDDIENQV
jgi:hypothetical protein